MNLDPNLTLILLCWVVLAVKLLGVEMSENLKISLGCLLLLFHFGWLVRRSMDLRNEYWERK